MTPTIVWRLKRGAITTFLVLHLAALAVWNMPSCPLQAKCVGTASYYMQPLGLWQNWAMFAPNPAANTITLEAIAIDREGMLYHFEFPKMADYSLGEGILRVRHSKYTSYFGVEAFDVLREMAARHVIRSLAIPAAKFPVELELQYRIRETPAPGIVPDPMAPTRITPIKAYRFDTPEEAQP